jgi:hypothetical protein
MLYYDTGVGYMPIEGWFPGGPTVVTPNARGPVAELEHRLADAQARLPKHSTPMAMMIQIEELEEALAHARAQALVQSNNDAPGNS